MIRDTQENRDSRLARLISTLILLTTVIFSLTANSFAQNPPANPQRGYQPGSSHSISDIEAINTTNGNLMMNIPLVSLPKGRGEVGESISLMYNSKSLRHDRRGNFRQQRTTGSSESAQSK